MKKKLNLLWNLKFNFFSVAERPLTFFAYFLNAKKVGRRRLVIVPATAGGLPLFPHAASVPAPALAPVRSHFACGETARPVIGPTGADVLPFPSRLRRAGAPTAKPRRLSPFGSISLRETALAGRCPRRGQRARYPIFALLKCGPALAPRRSSAYASVSPAAKPRVRSSAPPFGFAAQNQARHFAARNHPVRLSASRP